MITMINTIIHGRCKGETPPAELDKFLLLWLTAWYRNLDGSTRGLWGTTMIVRAPTVAVELVPIYICVYAHSYIFIYP